MAAQKTKSKHKRFSRRKPGRPAGVSGAERKAELLEAARKLATLKSIDAISLRSVAQASGVAPPLIRYYFQNREGLQRALLAHMAATQLPKIKALASTEGPVEDRLRAVIKGWLRGSYELEGLMQIVFTHVLDSSKKTTERFLDEYVRPLVGMIRPIIDQGVAEGKFRQVEYMFFHLAVGGAFVMFVTTQPKTATAYAYHGSFEESLERFGDYVADVFLNHLMIKR